MTTTALTPTLRAALKRLLESRNIFLVNANGDITDLDTYISLNPGTPRGTWHNLSYTTGPRALLAADEITTTDEGITLRTGDDATSLDSEVYDSPLNWLTPAHDEPRLTIRSSDGHNRVALSVVASTAETDMYLPILTAARLRGNDAGPTGTDPQSVTALSTDRYLATHATLTAEPADVEALLPKGLLQELARRKSWTMTTTNTVTAIEFDDIGITVTARNLDADYPPAERLYPSHRDDVSSIAVHPKALADTLKSLSVAAPLPAILTSDGTVYAEGTQETLVPHSVGTTGDEASPVVALDPRFIIKQARAVGARWDSVTISWGSAIKPATMNWGHGIEGLIMPVRFSMSRPAEGEVAHEIAA